MPFPGLWHQRRYLRLAGDQIKAEKNVMRAKPETGQAFNFTELQIPPFQSAVAPIPSRPLD
jgi:hypothetical protein